MKLKCRDLKAFTSALEPGDQRKLVVFRNTGRTREFLFFLDKSNYRDIKKMFPVLNGPLFENLEPQIDEKVTEEEYLDIVEFAMEKAGREAVLASSIDLRIKAGGRIVSYNGGVLKEGVIHYSIPLIDILLLNEPLEFSVKYTPLPR